MSANELIERCKAGDRQALDLLYLQAKPRLLSICRQFATEEDTAEDLLHDAFVIIYTSLSQLKDSNKLEAWMVSIVRNVGYHYREHLQKEQTALQQLSREEIVSEEATAIPDYDQLQSLVTLLPKGYQQVFRLSVFEGLTHQEIGELLGITPHSSSSQLSHAKQMLRLLVKRSWVLILLLIAIPTVIWKMRVSESHQQGDTAPQILRQEDVLSKAVTSPDTVSLSEDVITSVAMSSSNEGSEETIPHTESDETAPYKEPRDITPHEEAKDTLTDRQRPMYPTDEPHYTPGTKSGSSPSWNISLAYNGQIGQRDDYLAAATIGQGSFNAVSNSPIPFDRPFDNWIDYNYYLNNSIPVAGDAETRSLTNIAAQNSAVNGGRMEARHEHRLPVTIQLMLNRQLSPHLFIETGLSYTQMKSNTITGSAEAYVQERQRLRYLGIPLRLGYKWLDKPRFSLYTSAGVMLELPIHSTLDVQHIYHGGITYQDKSVLSVPCQWSTSVGIGAQYDLTPHLGIYLEPSLQYFIPDGSDIQSYRTEHPLQLTLPFGIRFHW